MDTERPRRKRKAEVTSPAGNISNSPRRFEAVDVGNSEAYQPRNEQVHRSHEDSWARNFREGLNKMIADSPIGSQPRAVYLREVKSKGRRDLQKLYPLTYTNEFFPLSISDFPKIPSEVEIEKTFHEVWYQVKAAVEGLCQFMVRSRNNIFDKNIFVKRVRPEIFFFESHHKDYAIIAGLFELFLESFEAESFRSTRKFKPLQPAGWQQSFDFGPAPEVRAVRSYQYFKSGRILTDVDYIEWFRAKVTKFCKKFKINMARVASFASKSDGAMILRVLGGPYLLSYFTDVAKACWDLQTLAFAFKDPVVRLKVADGERFEERRMVPVVDFEKEELELAVGEDGELTVSFLVSPGFRFPAGSVIRAEVYLVTLTKTILPA
ncbi:hypothetical protein R1flu_001984 [Riccia fluitans]|uniref:Uncharacterized protein n=1 Tax=Riccia fluitans TaxID=41844 RepID=A0ABD1Y4T6_9MARC